MRISTLVVNANWLDRQNLRAAIACDPELSLVAECDSATQVLSAIKQYSPALMFLDLQLPGLDCFGLVAALAAETLRATIFIGPQGNDALQSLRAPSFRYLESPVSSLPLTTTLQDVKSDIKRERSRDHRSSMASGAVPDKASPSPERIVIKTPGRMLLIRTEEIDWIEAFGNYVRVHIGEECHLYRQTLRDVAKSLGGSKFIRIHRSAIVNLDKIRELKPCPTGEYAVFMKSGKELTLTRKYRSHLPFFGDKTSPDNDCPVPSIM